ncbi:MAG: redox-sensing transcriptional repressor Rex [Peptostreptococcaceae bacterium]|nr:redox-sensing transcriptional repressor Rex [Peptostreptococcaceae bacterium]
MAKNTRISSAVIKRLPRYRRYLNELRKKGVTKISSNELSALIGYTASQIRQDLNTFGGFGQQGYGYNVEGLYNEISAILGLDKEYKMVMVGSGNLGQAITNYTYYYRSGFKVLGLFDINPKIIGLKINDIEVYDFENIVEFVEENNIDIGVICVTRDNAQEVADKLIFAGIKGIWNFTPIDIEVPDRIALENVHLSENLHTLAFQMNNMSSKEATMFKQKTEVAEEAKKAK